MSKRTQRKVSAFSAGRQAFKNGMLKGSNPYPNNGKSLNIVFLAGFNHQKQLFGKGDL